MNTPPDPQPLLKPGETINEMGIRLYSERPDPQQAAQKCMGCGIDLPSNHPFTVCDPCWDKYPPGTPMPSGFKQSQFRVESPAQNGGEKKCPTCGGVGGIDSGGMTPWGEGINIPCPSCSQPTPEPSSQQSAWDKIKEPERSFLKSWVEPPSQQGEWKVIGEAVEYKLYWHVNIQVSPVAWITISFPIEHSTKEEAEATAKRICEAVNGQLKPSPQPEPAKCSTCGRAKDFTPSFCSNPFHLTEHAKLLKRIEELSGELKAAQDALKQERKINGILMKRGTSEAIMNRMPVELELSKAQDEVARLREDKARLDWMESNRETQIHFTRPADMFEGLRKKFPNGFWRVLFGRKDHSNRFETLREAIDQLKDSKTL